MKNSPESTFHSRIVDINLEVHIKIGYLHDDLLCSMKGNARCRMPTGINVNTSLQTSLQNAGLHGEQRLAIFEMKNLMKGKRRGRACGIYLYALRAVDHVGAGWGERRSENLSFYDEGESLVK
jgi:hypothetical protein